MKINIKYFASLRDDSGMSDESLQTSSLTIDELYNELNQKYHFSIDRHHLRVAQNEEYVPFETKLNNNDTIVFIPPVAGG